MLKSLSVWSYVLDILAVAVALIIGLVRKNKELRPVLLFVISSLIFDIVPFFFVHNQGGRTLHNEMFNISVVIELTILYYYYQTLLERPAFLYCLYTLYAIFSGLILYLWLGPMHTFKVFWVTLYGVENLFLTIPCFLYFYQLFRSDDAMDLKSNPHFFVVSGIIFFYSTTFPFYISYNMMYDVTPELLYIFLILNNLLSSVLFVTIIKANLCRPPEKKLY